jgi:DNA invertase Pin-like site-specific DNA recombinase
MPKANKSQKTDMLDTLTNNVRKATVSDNSNNAIIYLRSSSASQNNEENNQHSLVTQKSLCINYARENGFNIISMLDEVRRANDITKLKINNIPDNFSNINLIIADPSRMARDIIDGADFMKRCQDSNITIHSVRDNSVSDTSLGKRKIIDSVMIANDESDTVRKRINTMIQIKKRHGSKFGRVPFGYNLEKKFINDNGYTFPINIHTVNEGEQLIIKLIGMLRYGCEINTFYQLFRSIIGNSNKKLYYQGKEWTNIQYKECTMDFIADLLNEHNILIKGEKWNVAKVSSILKKIPAKDKRPYNMSFNKEDLDSESENSSDFNFNFNNNQSLIVNKLRDVKSKVKAKPKPTTSIRAPIINQPITRPIIQSIIKPIANQSNEIVEEENNDFDAFLNNSDNNSVISHQSESVPLSKKSKTSDSNEKTNNVKSNKKYIHSKMDKLKSIFDNMISLIRDDSDSE